MPNYFLLFFLILTATQAFCDDIKCENWKGEIIDKTLVYPDPDSDGYANSDQGIYVCNGQFEYTEGMRDENDQLIIDCAPNDPRRGRLVNVFPDADKDGYALVGSSMSVVCYGGNRVIPVPTLSFQKTKE